MPQIPPVVTVIMPVYNGAQYLKPAVDSILSQTYPEIELIVINDGSTDQTGSILEELQTQDKRLKLLNQPNQGASAARNAGLRIAGGKYVALMDADDISHPSRITKCVDHLEGNPDVVICGTWARTIGGKVNRLMKAPVSPTSIKCELLINSTFIHSTVMLRRNFLAEHNLVYDGNYNPAEDYDLWVRAADYGKMQNLRTVLLYYRLHDRQLSQSQSDLQRRCAQKVRMKYLEKFGIIPTAEEIKLHEAIIYKDFVPDEILLSSLEGWLIKLLETNKATDKFPQQAFREMLGEHWYGVCLRASIYKFDGWKIWQQSELSRLLKEPLSLKAKYFIRCKLENNLAKFKN